MRAGLVTAAAFPITLGDECVGVIELYAGEVREPNGEVSALFATVGGQLASYLARRRVRARARRSFDGAEALIVALDEHGRVEIANGTACRGVRDSRSATCWAATGSPSPCPSPSAPPRARPSRACWRARARELAGDPRACSWRWSLSRDADGTPIGALGLGRAGALPWGACAGCCCRSF